MSAVRSPDLTIDWIRRLIHRHSDHVASTRRYRRFLPLLRTFERVIRRHWDVQGQFPKAKNPPLLSENDRTFFETRFGRDFSQVRMHTDTSAAETAKMMNARAYTIGQNVVFGTGQYAPDTQSGKKLIAHELAHVMQRQNNTIHFWGTSGHTKITELAGNSLSFKPGFLSRLKKQSYAMD